MKEIIELREPVGQVTSPRKLFDSIQKINIDYDKENFLVFFFNPKSKLITKIIATGTLNNVLVGPREVFREAIKNNTHHILLAHNHPSECLEPSEDDIVVTNRLIDAGKLLDIKVLDHIIFNKKEYYSLRRYPGMVF